MSLELTDKGEPTAKTKLQSDRQVNEVLYAYCAVCTKGKEKMETHTEIP